MDLRLKFNEDVLNYDKFRPTYTEQIFEDIINYSSMNESKKALEIGIGTGQATLPLLKIGCSVTAVELGGNSAEFVKMKYSDFAKFQVVNTDFESYDDPQNSYDLIYSATAFHWVKQDIGFVKIFDLLKHGGTVALFWNHPFINCEDDQLHLEIRKIYMKYKPSDKIPVAFNEDKCQEYQNALSSYGFVDIVSKLYYKTRTLTGQEYISLLNTYSDHRALPEDIKVQLEQEISSTIDNFDGKLHIYDTMDLYLARKP